MTTNTIPNSPTAPAVQVHQPPVEVSQETSNTPRSTSDLCQRTNGDQPLSADTTICPTTVTNPSPFDNWEPILTYNGIKWIPTIAPQRLRSCPACPVYTECSIDVARGDFAWCEDIIPADYELTNDTHTAHTVR